MASRPKKILFGAVDIGLRIEQYCEFINTRFPNELRAESLVVFPGPAEYYTARYTRRFEYGGRSFLYRWYRSALNFITCIFRYDVFHFLSGETLLTRRLRRMELALYKFLGKKVIMHFVGADIRNPEFITWKEENIQTFLAGKARMKPTTTWQDRLIADARQFADHILVSTPDLRVLVPEAVFYPVVLETDKFLRALTEVSVKKMPGDPVGILHAPSNTHVKGTYLIHQVLKTMKTRWAENIRLILPADKSPEKAVYPTSRKNLMTLYQEADIVIDQVVIGWYGLQAVEALAAGAQVICYIAEDLKPFLFPDCPIAIADANTLESVIAECICKHKAGLSDRGKNIAWVRKYHDIQNNHQALLDAWGLTPESQRDTPGPEVSPDRRSPHLS